MGFRPHTGRVLSLCPVPPCLPGIFSLLLGRILASLTHPPGRLTHPLAVICAAPVGGLHPRPFCPPLLTPGGLSAPGVALRPTALLCFCPQELLHYLIGTLLLLIASIVAASKSYSQSELVAASVRISSGRLRRESVLSKLVSFLTGTAEGLFSGALLSQNRYPPWSSQPGLQRGLHGGSREVNHQGCWHTNRPSGPGLSLAPATQIGWHVDLKSRVRGGHVLVAASAPCRDIVWSLVGPREQHCDLLVRSAISPSFISPNF